MAEHPRGRSLTETTTRGFSWVVMQVLTNRLVNTVGRLFLAWLLLPEVWGLIGLTYTVTTFGELFRALGVQRVLVHRQRSIRLWENAAFWMSASMGVVAMLAVMAVAKPIALAYEAPELARIIVVLSLATPIRALSTVPVARMQANLRFRPLAMVDLLTNSGTMVLTIVFALLGFEVYSFIWPQLIVAVIRTASVWRIEPPRLRAGPQLRRWKYLLGDSLRVLGATVLQRLALQAAAIVLGLLSDTTIVGLFYFGAGIAANPVRVFVQGLSNVLFPVLSRIRGDAARQTRAFIRASRILALLVVPACFLQAGLTDPLVRLLLADRWLPAIPVIQILSLGAAFTALSAPSNSVLQAQGRFGAFLRLMALQTALAFGLILVATPFKILALVAAAVSLSDAIMGPLRAYLALRPSGGTLRDAAGIFAMPVAVSIVALGAGLAAAAAIPAVPLRDAYEAIVIFAVFVPLSVAGIRMTMPADACDAMERLRSVLRRRRPADATEGTRSYDSDSAPA